MLDAAGIIRDLSSVVTDIAGDTLLPDSLARIRKIDAAGLPAVTGSPRIGPCVGSVGKFVCVGLNYSDHAGRIEYGRAGGADHLHEGDLEHFGSVR